MKNLKNYIIPLFVFCLFLVYSNSFGGQKIKVGIDEQLGHYIPMDLKFTESDGKVVSLKELITKPTILAFVYYECPGLCNPMQSELAWTIDKLQLEPGKDFQVISLSFDHRETPEIAAKWKHNYLQTIKRKFDPKDWIFLTGDSISIKKITDACGYRFRPADKQYVHAATLIAISPEGKITRYMFGIQFNPFDMKMALLEAEAGRASPTIAKVLQFCFSYDPSGRRYTLNLLRIIGSISLLGAGIFLGVLLLKKKKKIKNEGV